MPLANFCIENKRKDISNLTSFIFFIEFRELLRQQSEASLFVIYAHE